MILVLTAIAVTVVIARYLVVLGHKRAVLLSERSLRKQEFSPESRYLMRNAGYDV